MVISKLCLAASLAMCVFLLSLSACDDENGGDGDADGDTDGDSDGDADADGDSDGDADGDSDGDSDGDIDPGPSSECGSLRMTQYGSSDVRWCGFDRTHPILPDFVREGMTVAVAEPWNGSSYGGDPGEACGECWEVDTLYATQIVMVHDLCPIEGNPICAGDHFHFDLANEAADVLGGGGWLGEASARRVPCPVTGNIQARISDRNEWGYLKLAFFNHRFPIRLVEYQPVGSDEWRPMERCLARWCEAEDMDTFASDGPGAVFRLTSAAGEVVVGEAVLPYALGDEAIFDTGIQFAPAEPEGGSCVFMPPADVYDEQWGGIEGVRWSINTWGDPVVSEASEGCADSSESCLLVGNFESGDGFHITYRNPFPRDMFTGLTLRLRSLSGSGDVNVAPRSEESRCANTSTVDVGDGWTTVEIDLSESCPDTDVLSGLTISHPSMTMDLVIDEVFFNE